MELEQLFTASKWEILQLLAEQPLSPLQIAERSSTTLANVSQQLRLLEMAGLVRSERIPNRDKGLPRIVYRLAGDQSYFIATTSDFAEKKLLKLSAYNKAILRIWFFEDPEVRYLLEKAFWAIEPKLASVERLGVHHAAGDAVEFCVVSDRLSKSDFPDFVLKNLSGASVHVRFDVRKKSCGEKSHVLYERAASRISS